MADKDPKDILRETAETAEILRDAFTSLGATIKSQLTGNLQDADDYTKSYVKNLRSGVGSLMTSLGKSGDKLIENQIKLNKGQLTSKDISKQINEFEDKKLKALNQVLNARKNEYISADESRKLYNQIVESVEEGKKGLEQQSEAAKKLEKNIGVLGKAVKGLNKIPILGGLIEGEKVLEDIQQAAAAKDATRLSTLKTGFISIGKSIVKGITDPLTIFTFLVTQINKADQQATALGKSFGVSKVQARAIREEFVKYSANVNDNFINTDRLLKAQAELSEQLGIAVQFSGEELATFSKLTEIVGLSAQEAGKLASFSAAAGIGTKDYVKQIRLSVFASNQANKVHFSSKQILQDISKLSAGILVKFQNNPKALTDAVVQARKLGLSLEQVDKIGESLLNFESSIENELKAELLTNKQLNLEKARYAALTGDQATLSAEIAKQAGSLADFQNMNVLAQKSLAEAFGMSREELADMLLKQEAINTYGKDAAKLNAQQIKDFEKSGKSLAEYLTDQDEQLSIQNKFNNAILKLQDLIGNLVAGPLGGFIDSLSNGLETVTKIFGVFGKIGSTIKGFFGDKIGGAMGEFASIATIGGLILLLSKSMMKGTTFNPMIVKDVSAGGGAGGGGGLSGGIFGKGGMKQAGNLFKKGLKSNAFTSLAMGGIEAVSNISEGKSAGESIGRSLISGLTSFGGGALGSLIAPGAGTVGGGILGGMLGDKINDLIFGEQAPQQVEDGVAPSNKGPFTVTDRFGATSITAKGDSLAVSPNVNNSSLDLTPMINAINEVRTAVTALANRPINSTITIDGKQIGTAVGKQMETGTSQNIYTGYKLA